jgi:hypothetical protein
MGFLDDVGNAIAGGAEAVVDTVVDGAEAVVETIEEAVEDTEEAIDEAMKEVGEWFIEKMQEAVEDFFNDGGTDVGHNEFEERATVSSELELARVIPYEYARPFGSDDDELTIVPSPFTSRFSEVDPGDFEVQGVHLASDGAIGGVGDITIDIGPTPQRSPDRAEDHDRETTGGAGSEIRDDSPGERREDASPDTLLFNVHSDAPASHTPEWTNFNDADPSITLADGGWMRDVSYSHHSDRGSHVVEIDFGPADHASVATTLADASPTLSMSWLF